MLRSILAAALCLALAGAPAASGAAALPIRVVVVTTFELGNDAGDAPGEFQTWVERFPLAEVLPFPQGYHHLRLNRRLAVLGLVSGEGPARMAASLTALGSDPRFDLHHAYFVIAGIAGIDPNFGSVASAVWAKHVVNGGAYEIDAREIPKRWATGYVPFERASPYALPVPPASGNSGTSLYTLDAGLTDWAYARTAATALPEGAALRQLRARYTDAAPARRPAAVREGDTLASGTFWVGAKLNAWAEAWTRYWTHGHGVFATTEEEDAGALEALTFLARAGRVDPARVLVLRTASDYDEPPPGQSAAELLAAEASAKGFVAYRASLESAYLVGSRVVRELATRWRVYRARVPGMTRPERRAVR